MGHGEGDWGLGRCGSTSLTNRGMGETRLRGETASKGGFPSAGDAGTRGHGE
ncbi:MAG: hypothetical protein KME21_02700 [Desmonostoc vinosum HA7617-LM4]|nr:hypothetical protein [Desmonostoc vinosum HA7617-LM4]